MKVISKSPARGFSRSRSYSSGTLMAGESLVLPSARVPVVIQNLTPSQISAIPQGKIGVKVLGRVDEVGVRNAISQARALFPDHKVGVVVRGRTAVDGAIGIKDDGIVGGIELIKGVPPYREIVHRMLKRRLGSLTSAGRTWSLAACSLKSVNKFDDGERKLVTIMDILGKAYTEMKDFREGYRQERKSGGGGTPPQYHIFLPPINEDEMADCTLMVKDCYFGCNDTCMIGEKTWNITEFCLLMFLAFGRMHLLKNYSRKPFCEFLQNKVLMSDEQLKVKNFNNYANRPNYHHLEEELPKMPFNLDIRLSQHNNPLFLACHEIGRSFHNSAYFTQLRNERENLKRFEL